MSGNLCHKGGGGGGGGGGGRTPNGKYHLKFPFDYWNTSLSIYTKKNYSCYYVHIFKRKSLVFLSNDIKNEIFIRKRINFFQIPCLKTLLIIISSFTAGCSVHDERFCSDWNIFLEETEKTAKVILDESSLGAT